MLKALYNFGKNKKGFTLIELLIVVAIIAILAAIAIPQFASYRRRGYNAAANSDLRNIRTTQEAMFADFQDYGYGLVGTPGGAILSLVGGDTRTVTQTVSLSPKVMAVVRTPNAAGAGVNTHFIAKSTHTAGDQIYGVESDYTQLWRSPCAAAGACLDTAADLLKGPDASVAGTQDFGAPAWLSM
jgi:prepilin-type N-terminal cleavage/methylation domain-containing protein